MIKHIKIILLMMFTAVFIGIVFSLYKVAPLLGSNSILMPNKTKIEDVLIENLSDLVYVSKMLYDCDSQYVIWNCNTNDTMTYYDNDNKRYIDKHIDSTMQKKIDKLQDAQIENIEKQNNYVMFVIWSSLDSSCGLIYCPSGNPNVTDYGQTNTIKLYVHNWYYFNHISD